MHYVLIIAVDISFARYHHLSSGGVTSQELVRLFANKYESSDVKDSKWVYTFLEASKLAYADRNQYLADPKFVKQPVNGLLDANYLSQRSKLITESALATPVLAGVPAGIDSRYAPDASPLSHMVLPQFRWLIKMVMLFQ